MITILALLFITTNLLLVPLVIKPRPPAIKFGEPTYRRYQWRSLPVIEIRHLHTYTWPTTVTVTTTRES